jgi:thiol-disulfide isomerase/thioredoxin
MNEKTTINMEFIYSEGCPDCPPAKDIVERVKEDYEQLDVDYVEVQDEPDKIHEFDITHVPTIIINGNVEFVETLTEKRLRSRLEEIING